MPAYPRFLLSKGIALVLIFGCKVCFSQSFDKAASNAFMITRLADKFHIQPRNFNDTFSAAWYDQLMKLLDPERIFFNKADTAWLSPYRFKLNREAAQKKTDFLRLITSRYAERLRQADTMIDHIAETPFNFLLQEKLTLAEDTTYPADLISMRQKLYKKMKLAVLAGLLEWQDSLPAGDSLPRKKTRDSLRAVLQQHAGSVYKRSLKEILQSPGGIEQYVSDQYCKALASCYDPHTEFFPLSEKENFETGLGSRSFRFGFSIYKSEDGGVAINSLEPGSPAFRCGLLNKGDKFQTLQWKGQKAIDVSDADIAELAGILSQSNHDELTITVKKPDGSLRTVTLMKQEGDAGEDNKVKSFLLKGDKTFGYISLPAFYNNWETAGEGNNGCANDVAKEVLELKGEHISGLIIDLRYNGGGAVQEAVELAGIFIDAGPVAQVEMRGYDKVITLKDVDQGTIYDGPLIILVNGYTASASELVAGALQDYHRALIVGSDTYGKATGQVILPLDTSIDRNGDTASQSESDYLKITTSKLYRVNGTTAQFGGVKPDIVLAEFPEAGAQKESSQPFALRSASIAANPYYKPYPPLPLKALQTAAARDVDTLSYFIQLAKYTREYQSLRPPAEASLDWASALADEKAGPRLKQDTTNYTGTYRVQNNAFDLEDIEAGATSTDINGIFIHYLEHDPYIKICYDLLKVMAK